MPGAGSIALGAGALLLLPNLFTGLFGGGYSGGGGGSTAGAIGDIIQLLPLVILGGGALYAVQVFKK